ncbi:hypothetical protein PI125_g25987 [Phytophthora idaei]|nr:hypothetical protein PI125_g25987 [Phytophthora idaei]
MKLPEDRELCVIDLDWKKQVRRTTTLRNEQPQTKKKSLEIKIIEGCWFGVLCTSCTH